MMLERYLLQVLVILAIGDFLSNTMRKLLKRNEQQDYIERGIKAIIYGYLSLTIPMLTIGILVERSLGYVSYIHFGIGSIILTVKLLNFFRKIHTYRLENSLEDHQKLLAIFIALILTSYGILSLFLPERGWDALHFYLPNALYFFTRDNVIPTINPFSFYPTFKPPVNVLYITYSLYVAKGMYANLHPFVFLVGSTLAVYKLGYLLTDNRDIGLIAASLFTILPIITFLIFDYAYYQELPLLFFFTTSFYYLYKNQNKNSENILISSISIAMAILSKISGYAIIIIILLSFDIEKVDYKLKMGIAIAISLFMVRKASYNIFIGSGIFILFLLFLLLWLLHLDQDDEGLQQMSLKHFGILIIFPVIVGILWIIYMLQIEYIGNFLVGIYLKTESTLKWMYPAITNPRNAYFENGMRISFLASILYIFTSNFSGLPLMVPKLWGIRFTKKYRSLFIWFLSFFIIFFGYFSNVSGRYLIPILPPMIIIASMGLYDILSKLMTPVQQSFTVILFAGSLILFYLPVLPFRYNGFNILNRFWDYHHNQTLLIIYALLFGLLIKFLSVYLDKLSAKNVIRLTQVIVLIVGFIPIIVPGSIYLIGPSAGQDPTEVLAYAHRETYQQLVDEIRSQDTDITDIVMSVNTPGLEYFTRRPVLDIFMVSGPREVGVFFDELNQTEAWNFMEQPTDRRPEVSIRYIVKLNEGHIFYPIFKRDFSGLPLLSIVEDGPYFTQLMENKEFTLYIRNPGTNFTLSAN